MSNNSLRLLNIALQILTLGTRFLLIFYLAKYLDPALVGYYGLFVATVSYSIYFIGLDFYTYVTREVIKTHPEQRGQLLKGQVALSGLLYIAFLPFGIFFLYHSNWPSHLIWWFFPILLLEYLNQEIARFLVATSKQITASLILFVRQGSWVIVLISVLILHTPSRSLDTVIALWATGGVIAAMLGIWKVRQLRMGGWGIAIDWRWIRKGVGVSISFLIATLALRGIQTADRYWLEALGGVEMVGAYVILLGIASTLIAFLDAGIFAFTYPVLIKLEHQKAHAAAKAKVLQMLLQTLILSAIFSLCSWLVLPHLLGWIGNPIYLSVLHWYPWLLSAMVLNALSMVPHFGLYARGLDRQIILSHIGALVVFVVAVWILSQTYSVLAVPIGMNMAFGFILLWKASAYLLQSNVKQLKSQPPQIDTASPVLPPTPN